MANSFVRIRIESIPNDSRLILVALTLLLWIARLFLVFTLISLFSEERDTMKLVLSVVAYLGIQSYAFWFARQYVSDRQLKAGVIVLGPVQFFEQFIPLPIPASKE